MNWEKVEKRFGIGFVASLAIETKDYFQWVSATDTIASHGLTTFTASAYVKHVHTLTSKQKGEIKPLSLMTKTHKFLELESLYQHCKGFKFIKEHPWPESSASEQAGMVGRELKETRTKAKTRIIPDEVLISLNAPVTQPTTFDIVISGTATLGDDYLLTLPGSVTFNTGNEVFTFPIQALSDGLPEGTETIIIQLVRDFGCGATVLATLEIQLQDNLQVQIFEDQLDTVLVCEGNGAQMNANGAADYFWQPPGIFSDPNISNPIVTPLTSQWVTVSGTLGVCSDIDSVFLLLIDPQVNIFPEGTINICQGDSVILTATNNVNNSNLQWSTFFFTIPDALGGI